MIKQVILNYDQQTGAISDSNGVFIGNLSGPVEEYIPVAATTLALVKQGVSVEEIVKLKNNDLI